MKFQSHNDACVLYAALENMLGDWYLFSLGEINRDAINEGSASEGMKILKRLQQYRADDMRPLAIGQKRERANMEPRYPETELQGEPLNGSSLNVECDYCANEAIALAGGLPLCAVHCESLKANEERQVATLVGTGGVAFLLGSMIGFLLWGPS